MTTKTLSGLKIILSVKIKIKFHGCWGTEFKCLIIIIFILNFLFFSLTRGSLQKNNTRASMRTVTAASRKSASTVCPSLLQHRGQRHRVQILRHHAMRSAAARQMSLVTFIHTEIALILVKISATETRAETK